MNVYALGPMRPEDSGKVGVVDLGLRLGADREYVKHLGRVRSAMTTVEAFRTVELLRQRIDSAQLRVVCGVTSEHEDLEPGVCGQKVLKLVRSAVCCADENVREHALADDEVGGVRLICGVHDVRGRVVNPYAGGE